MSSFELENYQPAYREQVIELYKALQHDKENVIYWWPGQEEFTWEYCPCVFKDGKLIAKGQVMTIVKASSGEDEHVFHQIFMNLKVHPDWEDNQQIKEMLFDYLYEKAKKLKKRLPAEFKTKLRVGNFSTEIENNQFFMEKGLKHYCSLFWMERDLQLPLERMHRIPEELDVKEWKMESEQDELQYMQVEHQIWPDSAITKERLHEYKKRELWTAFTAFHNGEIVGSAMAWVHDKQEKIGEIEDIFVLPDWRRKGIARYLLMKAVDYLQKHQFNKAMLLVLTDNDNALNLYKSVGFEDVKEEQRFEMEI